MLGLDPISMLRAGLKMVDTDNAEMMENIVGGFRDAVADMTDEEKIKLVTLIRSLAGALGVRMELQ